MAETLKEAFKVFMEDASKLSKAADKIDESKVYEEANLETRKYMEKLTEQILLEGSGIENMENVKAFYDAVTKEGKRGVIMMEHYSNMDLPAFMYLLENSSEPWGKDFASRIVAIAGMKLNEANPLVRCLSESYTRVVIYPTRSISDLANKSMTEEERIEEEKRARKINFAAMRAMDTCKKNGQVILLFPSGTRYRPGQPETKKGLREIDSYLRLFDVMLLVGIKGNPLRINPEAPNDMTMDLVVPDKVIFNPHEMIDCKTFREEVLENIPADEPDPKQKTIDKVMEILDELHGE